MITLKEFLKILWHEQYRVYQPNRDCLIFESYLKVHSPYDFTKDFKFQPDYYSNNDYCDNVYKYSEVIDEETKKFLSVYGNYEVVSIETSNFKPFKMHKEPDSDRLEIEYVLSYRTRQIYENCIDIFIIPNNKKRKKKKIKKHNTSTDEYLLIDDPIAHPEENLCFESVED